MLFSVIPLRKGVVYFSLFRISISHRICRLTIDDDKNFLCSPDCVTLFGDALIVGKADPIAHFEISGLANRRANIQIFFAESLFFLYQSDLEQLSIGSCCFAILLPRSRLLQ